jgi:hypothetical protein
MIKLISAKSDNDLFEVYGEIDKNDFFESDFIVRVNGRKQKEFGETFAGVQITAQDKGEAIIRAYINNYQEVEWLYVAPEIVQMKASVTYNLAGYNTPDTFLCDGGYTAHLIAFSDTMNYYAGNEGRELFVVADKDNDVVTTYENFFVSAIVDDYKKKKLKVVDSNIYSAEATMEWIKEYCE